MTNIFSYNHIKSWLKKGWATIPKLNYGSPRYRFIFYTYTSQYNSMGNTLYITKDGEKDN